MVRPPQHLGDSRLIEEMWLDRVLVNEGMKVGDSRRDVLLAWVRR